MTDPHLEDHLVGLELQLVEQVEQRERATVQHRPEDAARIEEEIEELTEEMARTAEQVAKADAESPVIDAPEAGTVALGEQAAGGYGLGHPLQGDPEGGPA